MPMSETGPAYPAMGTLAARLLQIARQMRPGLNWTHHTADFMVEMARGYGEASISEDGVNSPMTVYQASLDHKDLTQAE